MQTTNLTATETAKSSDSINASKGDAAHGPVLPPLSPQDFKLYDHMAVHMDQFHNHFRSTWNQLYATCSTPPHTLPRSAPSLHSFINLGIQLIRQLTMHHTIEEQHIFPHLATRMPLFRDNKTLLKQHQQIHEGLERLEGVLDTMRSGSSKARKGEVDWAPLKACMDSFGTVLWTHLDAEVEQLGAENMRKFWSKEEMGRMPF